MNHRSEPKPDILLRRLEPHALWWVLGVGVVARLLAFFGLNPPQSAREGVSGFQSSIAQQILDNGRLYYALTDSDGFTTALNRPPLYGSLLAGTVKLTGSHYWGGALLQMLLAVGSLTLAYGVAKLAFGQKKVALVAALIAALYPYYVINTVSTTDRILQGLLLLAIVYVIIRCDRKLTYGLAIGLGVLCGLEILTRALMVLVLPMMLLWFCWPVALRRKRVKLSGVILVTTACIVAPWSIYAGHVVGHAQLSHSRPGYMLWAANNPTFDQCPYPVLTIDRCGADAVAALSPEIRKHIASLQTAERDQFYKHLALDHIFSKPLGTLSRALVKLEAAFSPIYNPRLNFNKGADTSGTKQLLYTIPYLLTIVLAWIGCATTWRTHGRFLWLVSLLFLAVAAFSGMFWAHSVEKLNVQVYIGILAAPGIFRVAKLWREWSFARKGEETLGDGSGDESQADVTSS